MTFSPKSRPSPDPAASALAPVAYDVAARAASMRLRVITVRTVFRCLASLMRRCAASALACSKRSSETYSSAMPTVIWLTRSHGKSHSAFLKSATSVCPSFIPWSPSSSKE